MMRWTFSRRRSHETRLDAELRYHIERQFDDYVRQGLLAGGSATPRRRSNSGRLELAKEECREVRPLHWLETTARDVRLGVRALARERLFTLSVTLILTIGIGATIAMFSVLNGVVLRPLPYSRPHEIAVLATHRMLQNQFDGTSRRELSRLAATEPIVRRHGAVPPHQRQPGRVRRRRRAAARAGRSGRRRSSSTCSARLPSSAARSRRKRAHAANRSSC